MHTYFCDDHSLPARAWPPTDLEYSKIAVGWSDTIPLDYVELVPTKADSDDLASLGR